MKYLLLLVSVLCACSSPDLLKDRAFKSYFSNDLKSSKKYFESYLKHNKNDIKTRLFYAENLRRLEDFEKAIRLSREVLERDSCNDFALDILGSTLNPQYGYKNGNIDSSWSYLLKTVKCNPRNGSAWLSIWILSFYYKDSSYTCAALKSLNDIGFFTPKDIAFCRWILTNLPDSALIFVNGDADTYPMAILQAIMNLRKDVAIINASLFNLPFYIKHISRDYHIPLLFTEDELDKLEHKWENGRLIETVSEQVIVKWVQGHRDNEIKRPICFSITLSQEYSEPYRSKLKYKGPYYQYSNELKGSAFDTSFIEQCLRAVNFNDFIGPDTTEVDFSPVRRSYHLKTGAERDMLEIGVWLAITYQNSGSREKALNMLKWIGDFEDRTKHYKDIDKTLTQLNATPRTEKGNF